MSDRLPRIALVVFVLGLALHNLAMAELWDVGVRGASLDVVAAWKDVLLAAALIVAILGARKLPAWLWADRLALAYTGVVVLYWVLPQGWLGDGAATHRGQLFAARHDLIPVAAYFLGRLLVPTPDALRRLSLAFVGLAVAVTAWGLADVYLVPLQWWRVDGPSGSLQRPAWHISGCCGRTHARHSSPSPSGSWFLRSPSGGFCLSGLPSPRSSSDSGW